MVFWHNWKKQYQQFNRNVKLFLLASLCIETAQGIFMVIYNFYIKELGFTEIVIGKVIAVTALTSAIVLIPAGILSDHVGRKKSMTIGISFAAISLLVKSVLSQETMITGTAIITGLGMAFYQVSIIPWLAENSTSKERIHLFSFHFALIMIANVIGNFSGGILSDTFQYLFEFSSLASIRITLLLAVIIFVCGLIPLFRMEPVFRSKRERIYSFSAKEYYVKHKTELKIILLFMSANLLIGFGSGLVIPYLNLYFADRFSASNYIVGIILSIGQAATAVAMIIGPEVVRRVGEVRAVVYLQLASLPFLLLTAYTQNLFVAVIGFLFRQALMNAGHPIQMSLMMDSVDDSMKGLANSLNQMVFQLGWALMGPVSTSIVLIYGPYGGYARVFTMTSILYLTGSTYFYLVFKGLRKKKIGFPSDIKMIKGKAYGQ